MKLINNFQTKYASFQSDDKLWPTSDVMAMDHVDSCKVQNTRQLPVDCREIHRYILHTNRCMEGSKQVVSLLKKKKKIFIWLKTYQ